MSQKKIAKKLKQIADGLLDASTYKKNSAKRNLIFRKQSNLAYSLAGLVKRGDL